MSESLVGKVLWCMFEQGGWVCCSKFCLVLEEKEDILLAVALASAFQDCGSYGLQWPVSAASPDDPTQLCFQRSDDPFTMHKFGDGHSGTVAYIKGSPHEGDYAIWDGHALKSYFIGY